MGDKYRAVIESIISYQFSKLDKLGLIPDDYYLITETKNLTITMLIQHHDYKKDTTVHMAIK